MDLAIDRAATFAYDDVKLVCDAVDLTERGAVVRGPNAARRALFAVCGCAASPRARAATTRSRTPPANQVFDHRRVGDEG